MKSSDDAALTVFAIMLIVPWLVALLASGPRSIGASILFLAAVLAMEGTEWRKKFKDK